MDISNLNFSIVITATDHNPSLINPDFLKLNNIINPKWEWKVLPPALMTPPFARVGYDSGVVIIVEPNKLHISQNGFSPNDSHLPEIVSRYIDVLPHIRYNAIGVNFGYVESYANADSYIRKRYLKRGAWDSEINVLNTAGVKFVYEIDGGHLSISVDSGTKNEVTGQTKPTALIVNANYNRECKSYPATPELKTHLSNVNGDWDRFDSSLKSIVGI